jgi:hypothetical protein
MEFAVIAFREGRAGEEHDHSFDLFSLPRKKLPPSSSTANSKLGQLLDREIYSLAVGLIGMPFLLTW